MILIDSPTRASPLTSSDIDSEIELNESIIRITHEKIEQMRSCRVLQTEHRYILIKNMYENALGRRLDLISRKDFPPMDTMNIDSTMSNASMNLINNNMDSDDNHVDPMTSFNKVNECHSILLLGLPKEELMKELPMDTDTLDLNSNGAFISTITTNSNNIPEDTLNQTADVINDILIFENNTIDENIPEGTINPQTFLIETKTANEAKVANYPMNHLNLITAPSAEELIVTKMTDIKGSKKTKSKQNEKFNDTSLQMTSKKNFASAITSPTTKKFSFNFTLLGGFSFGRKKTLSLN